MEFVANYCVDVKIKLPEWFVDEHGFFDKAIDSPFWKILKDEGKEFDMKQIKVENGYLSCSF
jgi:hypothetical protein